MSRAFAALFFLTALIVSCGSNNSNSKSTPKSPSTPVSTSPSPTPNPTDPALFGNWMGSCQPDSVLSIILNVNFDTTGTLTLQPTMYSDRYCEMPVAFVTIQGSFTVQTDVHDITFVASSSTLEPNGAQGSLYLNNIDFLNESNWLGGNVQSLSTAQLSGLGRFTFTGGTLFYTVNGNQLTLEEVNGYPITLTRR